MRKLENEHFCSTRENTDFDHVCETNGVWNKITQQGGETSDYAKNVKSRILIESWKRVDAARERPPVARAARRNDAHRLLDDPRATDARREFDGPHKTRKLSTMVVAQFCRRHSLCIYNSNCYLLHLRAYATFASATKLTKIAYYTQNIMCAREFAIFKYLAATNLAAEGAAARPGVER